MTTCVVFSWLNLTQLLLPHFSTFVKSLVRSEAEVLRYGEVLGEWMKKMNLNKCHQQRRNTGRCRGKQVIYEEDEQNRK